MSDVVVTMQDCRELRYCARGVRKLCERYGIDYSKFLAEGIRAEDLLDATNHDGMVVAVVEVARERK